MFGIIQEINNGYWHINEAYAETAKQLIFNLINGKLKQEDFSKSRQQMRPDYFSLQDGIYQVDIQKGNEEKPRTPENAPADSIGLIKIYGPITYNDQFCGPVGAETISGYLEWMSNNDNINAIILQIRSEGGETYACEKIVETIHNIEKPVIGFVQNYSFSAAARILVACDWCVANSDLALLGSLGTYVSLEDDKEYWEKMGIKRVEIYADKSTDKNKEHLEALKGNFQLIKAKINSFNEAFLQGVAKDRAEKLSAVESTWGTGKTWFSKEAMQYGLIDEIAPLQEVIKSLQNSFNS